MSEFSSWGERYDSIEDKPPIITIDRQIELEKFTDYNFSTSDKILGTVEGVKQEAKKDIDTVIDKVSSITSFIQFSSKLILIFFIINLFFVTRSKVKKWN